jgi:hypothetical protein
MKIQKQIQLTKATLNISYAEATKTVQNKQVQDEIPKEVQVYNTNNTSSDSHTHKSQISNTQNKKTQMVDKDTQTDCTIETQTDTNMDAVVVGPQLASLILGTINVCRNEKKFNSKGEVEYAMADVFRKVFGRELSGAVCKGSISNNESRVARKVLSKNSKALSSGSSKDKSSSEAERKISGDQMGPPQGLPPRTHERTKVVSKENSNGS